MSVGLILSNPAGVAFVFFVLILGMMQATRVFEVKKRGDLGSQDRKERDISVKFVVLPTRKILTSRE